MLRGDITMKKIIATTLILLVIPIVIGFSSTMKISDTPENNHDNTWSYKVDIGLEKGWNLIAYSNGFPDSCQQDDKDSSFCQKWLEYETILSKNQRTLENAPYIGFLLNPITKKYFKAYPWDLKDESLAGREEYYLGSAMWVYVKEPTQIKYYLHQMPQLKNINLYTGWNFVGTTPEFVDKSINEIKGSCDISKVYFYNPEEDETEAGTNWKEIPFDSEIPKDIVGFGLVIKVSDNCQLSEGSTPTQPPAIPN